MRDGKTEFWGAMRIVFKQSIIKITFAITNSIFGWHRLVVRSIDESHCSASTPSLSLDRES